MCDSVFSTINFIKSNIDQIFLVKILQTEVYWSLKYTMNLENLVQKMKNTLLIMSYWLYVKTITFRIYSAKYKIHY